MLYFLCWLVVATPVQASPLPNFSSWTLKSDDELAVKNVYHYQVYVKRRQTISLITTWDLIPVAMMKRDHRGTASYLYILEGWLLIGDVKTFSADKETGKLTITYTTVDGVEKITVW